jgi:hypothetical protein
MSGTVDLPAEWGSRGARRLSARPVMTMALPLSSITGWDDLDAGNSLPNHGIECTDNIAG